MKIDPDGLLLLAVVLAAFGFFIGWAGGVAEGRERERKRIREALTKPVHRPANYHETMNDTNALDECLRLMFPDLEPETVFRGDDGRINVTRIRSLWKARIAAVRRGEGVSGGYQPMTSKARPVQPPPKKP